MEHFIHACGIAMPPGERSLTGDEQECIAQIIKGHIKFDVRSRPKPLYTLDADKNKKTRDRHEGCVEPALEGAAGIVFCRAEGATEQGVIGPGHLWWP